MVWLPVGYWVLAVVVIGVAVLLTAQATEHRRYARSRSRNVFYKSPVEHVALFVPCKGTDVDSEGNLRALFEQDHENYELVFIVESVEDQAHELIVRLISEYPARQAKLIVAGMATTSGQKVHNLLVATEKLSPDVIKLAFADADVRPAPNWLRSLIQRVAPFSASSGYRWFVPKRPSLANLLLASIDGAIVPMMFPGIHKKIWGGSWAITREAFESTHMRDAWRGTLSDDLVASKVLARAKQPIALETACILPSPVDMDMRGMLSWVRRQLIIGRFYSPRLWTIVLVGHCLGQALFWGSVVATVYGLSLRANWTWQPASVVGLLYALNVCRAWTRHRASRFYLPHHQRELAASRRFDIWCSPLAGLVLCGAIIASAIGRRIAWKDNVYEIYYGGQIRKIPSPDESLQNPSNHQRSAEPPSRAA